MRSLIIVAVVTSAVLSDASGVERFSPDRVLSHEDVGAYHTDAFEQLAELYSEKRPTSRSEMLKDMRDIIFSYCAEGDSQCISNADRAIATEFYLAEQDKPRTVFYPANFQPELLDYIEQMHDALDMLDAAVNEEDITSLDEVLDTLSDIQNKVQNVDTNNSNNNKDVSDGYKLATLSGLAVAMESSKLWHAAYSNEDHPLYGLHHESYFLDGDVDGGEDDNRRRRLQNDASPADVARSDVIAALAMVINTALDSFESFDLLNVTLVIPNAISSSIAASAATINGDDNPTSSPTMSSSPTSK